MTILVTGATGNIGRKVVDELLVRGVHHIRALTTNPQKANLPDGVEIATGFIGKPETLDEVFHGVTEMYLAPHEATAVEVLHRARHAGVGYVVALSGAAHWQSLTDTILAAGIPATVLDPGEFVENLAGWAYGISTSGTVREPYPDAGSAPVTMGDIAAVAAGLLAMSEAERKHYVGETLELTGPQYLTRPQMAAAIGAGIGREVTFEQIGRAEAEEALRAGMGDMAGWYLDLLDESRRTPQEPNSVVDLLAGRPATTVAQWASENQEVFA